MKGRFLQAAFFMPAQIFARWLTIVNIFKTALSSLISIINLYMLINRNINHLSFIKTLILIVIFICPNGALHKAFSAGTFAWRTNTALQPPKKYFNIGSGAAGAFTNLRFLGRFLPGFYPGIILPVMSFAI